MMYCADKNGRNPGTVIHYQSAPVGPNFNIWSCIEQSDIIRCWNEGRDGLKHLCLWCYWEMQDDPTCIEEEYKKRQQDTVRIALQSPLLMHICCGEM